MNRLYPILIALASMQCVNAKEVLSSPDGNTVVTFDLNATQQPVYSMTYKGEVIVAPSTMGFELKDAAPLTTGFTVDKVDRSSSNTTWTPVWGENDRLATTTTR